MPRQSDRGGGDGAGARLVGRSVHVRRRRRRDGARPGAVGRVRTWDGESGGRKTGGREGGRPGWWGEASMFAVGGGAMALVLVPWVVFGRGTAKVAGTNPVAGRRAA